MNQLTSNAAQNITEAVTAYQKQSTGHTPQAVTVVLCVDTLVITLPEALTPGEKAMAGSANGAVQVQEFHRQLFATFSQSLRQEIQRITGRQVREAAAEIKPMDGAILYAIHEWDGGAGLPPRADVCGSGESSSCRPTQASDS